MERFNKNLSLILTFIIVFTSIIFYLPTTSTVQAAPNNTIYVYDLSAKYTNNKASEVYDEALFLATLQGIVNKKGPRFYIYHPHWPTIEAINFFQTNNIDKDIFNELRKPGQWLDGYTVTTLNTIDDVITQFSSDFSGIVTWDPRVEATVNVATTIAGIENTPAVMYGGKLQTKIISSPYNKTVSRNLNGQFSGVNAKTDAYNWAKTTFLDTASDDDCKTMSILEDGYARTPDTFVSEKFTSARDYLVKNKAFAFDLSVWSDEKANDAPEQGTGNDYNCLISILQTAQNKWGNKWPIEVIGFIPWWQKYTAFDSKSIHDTVAGEWKEAQVLSSYGASISQVVDTFGATNASFHSWAPYPARLQTQEAPARKTIANKTYICYFNGDHDGGTVNYGFNTAWLDPRRGQIPIAWGIVPNLIKDYPSLFSYLRNTATGNDYFWSGSSGSGYYNPDYMDINIWKKACEYYYDRAGYSMTGFILNGNAGTVSTQTESAFRDFSGDGICGLGQYTTDPDFDVRSNNVAVASILTDIDRANVDTAVSTIYNQVKNFTNVGTTPNFIVVRSSFALPSTLEQINKKLQSLYPSYNFEAVDPYSLFSLIRQKKLGQQAYDGVVTNIQWPERMVKNEKYDVKVTVRNTGTNTWTAANNYRLGADAANQFIWSDWQDGGYSNSTTDQRVYLSTGDSIAPQQTKTFTYKIVAPATGGTYNLSCKLVRDGVSWFGSTYTKAIQVVEPTAWEARLVSVTTPSEVAAGQSAAVSFTYKNIGTSTWTAATNLKLGALAQNAQNLKAIPNRLEWSGFSDGGSSTGVEEQRAYLSASDSITPGQTKTFTFNITAPYGRGKYVLSSRMLREGYEWFGDAAVKDITVVPSSRIINDAKKVVVTVPSIVSAGEKVNVAVSVRNTGTFTWNKLNNFRLSAATANQFMFADMQYGGYSNNTTDQRLYMSDTESVKPEETKTFNFTITAPSTAGTYKISLKMIKEGTGLFGDQMDVDISVKGALDASIRANDVPVQVAAGSETYINLAVTNTGSETWRRDTNHKLGSTLKNQFQFILSANDGYSANDGKEQRVYLPGWANIVEGQEHGFSVLLKAPVTVGIYTFEVGMVRDGVAWYGQTLTKTIQVVAPYKKAVNVGGIALTDENGYAWVADQAYNSGGWGYTGTTTISSTTAAITLNPNYYSKYGQLVYKSCRKGTNFGYKFDNVPNGDYSVKLLHADILSTASAQNLTSVAVEGYSAITGLDVYKNRGGINRGMNTEGITITVSDGVLNIDMSALAGNAFVNGIVVERIR